MISKIDNLYELKKLKSLNEIVIEDNPVLVLKESNEILKVLPVKTKDKLITFQSTANLMKNSSTIPIDETEQTSNNASMLAIPNKESSNSLTNMNAANDVIITDDQSTNIIGHIEQEWKSEFGYIIEHGYNGYNTKRLKESKINSGHAENAS